MAILKLQEVLDEIGTIKALEDAMLAAKQHGVSWDKGINAVFSVISKNTALAPTNVKNSKDGKISAIEKWVVKYHKGFCGRVSQRVSNPPGTLADPIIDSIIGARLSHLTDDDLNKISFAHRLSMSSENILGLFLEEYLARNLSKSGWHCAWGETVKSVDFVKENGELLQIKNRSNSENSSSVRVRDGTSIKKWYRIEASRIEYKWDLLNEMCGIDALSEDGFVDFVHTIIKANPKALTIEHGNPWKG
ncbi:MAG: SinI family restriction endonuclease [Robiginitomaculum sp.]|nr:SinI family restriction endonuclease [Robiginitomaculum sp.]